MFQLKFLCFTALLTAANLVLSISPAAAQPLTKPQLQKLYLDLLAAEGFKGEIDADGDVGFKFEGAPYYIAVNVDDQEFFRVLSSELFALKDIDQRQQAEAACAYATGKIKCAKAFISGGKARFSAEIFLNKPQDIRGPLFTRCVRALQSVRKTFLERMDE